MLEPRITITKRERSETNSGDQRLQQRWERNMLSVRQSRNSFPSSRRKLPPLDGRYKHHDNELNSNDRRFDKSGALREIASLPKKNRDKAIDTSEVTNSNSDGSETNFPKVARTIQMASTWLKKSRKKPQQQQQRADSFLERLEMFDPTVSLGSIEPSRDPFDTSKFNVATYKNWTIDPSGKTLFVWLLVIAIAVLYNLIFIIARQCFHQLHDSSPALWFVLDYLCDVIYGLDIFVQFRTAYLDQGLLVRDLKKLRKNYMLSRIDFKLDILSILPYDLLYFVVGTDQTIVRIPRILRLYRILILFQKSETKTRYPNVLRTSAVVSAFLLVFHWNACFYFATSEAIGFGSDKWVYPNLTSPGYDKLSRQYLYSVYWSARMMITGENENPPETNMELLFVIVDLTLGYLTFAALVGQFGAILGQIMRARVDFLSDSDTIKQYLQNNNVGHDLENRVVSWIEYMWQTKHSLDHERVLQKLPEKLRAQIAVYVHLAALRRVPIFADCEPGLLREIVIKLKSQVYSPGDYICRKGDVGKEMYVVKSGCLQVVGQDGLTVLATLSEGNYFGEISILNLTEIGNRRTADVRSVGFSDLLCLSKDNLLEALTDYPEARTQLEDRGRQLLNIPRQK
ncbi:cyclic nucleotide-gated channel rod photoreceptor subunit alpha-like [Actinia tenebrosa]|uniref:Cyclic nucleotide-gated channel rod photoreceptor subunit alpha-like n=1 Tax=Actinia tenebrosa TaxID=6105 RepID=A0A6P8HFL1_ACTTE|nr:cyclic nucleotide-gated channel rod photoreceptor subunit alpha-like [Actinia tenebrosa]